MARRKSSMNKIKLPTFLNKMLKSQLVLYLVLIGALINIIGYFQIQDYTSITLFIIIGLISKCFTKNMIIVLLVPIVIVNVLVASNMFTKVVAYEGLANKKQKSVYKPPPFEGLAGIQQQQKQITSQDEQSSTSTENTETYNQDNKKEIDDKLNTPENKKINDWLQKNDKPDNKLLHLLYKNPEYMKYVKLLANGISSQAVLNAMKKDRHDWGEEDSFIQDYMTATNLNQPALRTVL